jgi:hypothetical protein
VSGFAAPETQYVDLVSFESPVGNILTVTNGDFENWPASQPEPTNYPEDFSANATEQQIELSWTDASGAQLPDAYLILANDDDDFTLPTDGNFVPDDPELSDGDAAMNIAFGEETYTFTNLLPETTYYFQIFPYTNSGGEVDYKTDGTPPSATATTGELQPVLTVTAPQDGVTWYRGNNYDVLWEAINLTGDVLIEITGNASSGNPDWVEVTTVSAESGIYNWMIPTDYPIGVDFQFRISSMDLPVEALSGIFSISDEPEIQQIVINEIMYNPPPELGDDDYWEYIEIVNNDSETADLTGWSFSDGIDFTFPDGTLVEAGNYLVIARVPDSISDFYGITNLVGPFENGTALSNGGETVELTDSNGSVVDIVDYNDGGEWPSEPDGDGPSLSLINPDLDNSPPESWEASIVPFGTPGTLNNPEEPFMAVTYPNGGETLQKEISYNITWAYDDLGGSVIIELTSQSGYSSVLAESLDVTLNTWEWLVAEDVPVGDDYKITITSLENPDVTDESDDFFSIIDLQPVPELVITEIMYNPPESGNDSLEFIEIYNNDGFAAMLDGFYFGDGIEFFFPDITLDPGSYLLIAVDSMAMMNTFEVEAWQWSSGALSNGGELIELRDNFDNVVDFVEYGDQMPWDTLADGAGPSLTLCDPDTDNNLPENWLASAELAAVNDDGEEIFATPGGPCVTTQNETIDKAAVLTVFPNPNQGVFSVKTSTAEIINIKLLTLSGKTVSEQQGINGRASFSENLHPGIYLLRIDYTKTGKSAYRKLIIQH